MAAYLIAIIVCLSIAKSIITPAKKSAAEPIPCANPAPNEPLLWRLVRGGLLIVAGFVLLAWLWAVV